MKRANSVYDRFKYKLGGTGSHTKFDDFKVTGADVQGLAVEPEGKLSMTWGKIKMNF